MKTDIDRLVASISPDPGPGMTPGGRELLQEILDGKPAEATLLNPSQQKVPLTERMRLPRLSRWRLAAPLAALLVILGWAIPSGLGVQPASATLDITESGKFFVIKVKDLFADPTRYQAELQARGLKVTIKVVPGSPSQVGDVAVIPEDVDEVDPKVTHVIPPSDDITSLEDRTCGFWEHCTLGVRIRVGYQGGGTIWLTRKALPGERYQSPGWLAAPGEPLACIDFINQKVPDVLRLLKRHGVTNVIYTTYHGNRSSAPDSWYVHDGVMSENGQALLLVDPAPHPHPKSVDFWCDGPDIDTPGLKVGSDSVR
ncbi:hypothetical protein [Sphaerisporangium fuscum]|uniref:hypothetical protein n=1 Tax=Sphaerisporangium fuscum TaxID=2835868 RepID=UPI001BDD1213|nr:hypothetical protein [Sphaerisporangium fuscum]